MLCSKCGTQLPDEAQFCYKCGAAQSSAAPPAPAAAGNVDGKGEQQNKVVAPADTTALKCPSCGAPLAPKFGEMVITCAYCGSAVSLGMEGWKSLSKQTMLPLKLQTQDDVLGIIHSHMDKGLLHRHLQESSTLEEMTLTYVSYWIISASARTSIVAADATAQVGTLATDAALLGILAGAAGMAGGGRGGFGGFGGFGGGLLGGAMMGGMMGGGMMGGGMMGGGASKKAYQLDANYNFPVVALKSLTLYQPKEYQFALDERTFFDINKVPKGIQILNGDIGEEAAKSQAKTLVDQLQSDKAHQQYHMIQQISTDVDVSEAELMHAPVWFARYEHKSKKIVLVIDANSGGIINSIGL